MRKKSMKTFSEKDDIQNIDEDVTEVESIGYD